MQGYDKTIVITNNFVANANDNTVDVHFENVPTTASYTLSYIAADGTESVILTSTPYDKLEDDPGSSAPSGTPAPGPAPAS